MNAKKPTSPADHETTEATSRIKASSSGSLSFGELVARLRAGHEGGPSAVFQADLGEEVLRRLKRKNEKPDEIIRRIEHDWPTRLPVARAVIEALDGSGSLAPEELRELASAYLFLPDLPVLHQRATDSRLIAALIPGIDHGSFFGRLAGAIEDAVVERGYSLTICQHRDNPKSQEHHLERLLRDVRPAGLLFSPRTRPGAAPEQHRRTAHLLRQLQERGVPTLFLDRHIQLKDARLRVPYISIDNRAFARKAADFLVEQGHTRVGGLFEPSDQTTHDERREAFIDVLKERVGSVNDGWFPQGVMPLEKFPLEWVRDGYHDGRGMAGRVLGGTSNTRPTAIYCSAYFFVFDVLYVARRLDIDVPNELSIISVDDVPELGVASPPITRVVYDLRNYAYRVCEKLFDMIDHPNDGRFFNDETIPEEGFFDILAKDGKGTVKRLGTANVFVRRS